MYKNNEAFAIYFVEFCTLSQTLTLFKVMVCFIWSPVTVNFRRVRGWKLASMTTLNMNKNLKTLPCSWTFLLELYQIDFNWQCWLFNNKKSHDPTLLHYVIKLHLLFSLQKLQCVHLTVWPAVTEHTRVVDKSRTVGGWNKHKGHIQGWWSSHLLFKPHHSRNYPASVSNLIFKSLVARQTTQTASWALSLLLNGHNVLLSKLLVLAKIKSFLCLIS